VIGVAWNGSPSDYQAFVDRHDLTFPQLNDTDGVIFDRFQIPFQPAFALVPPDGEVELLIGSAGGPMLNMILAELADS
jgi:peroxiredoxin